jgi:hypothetical protein
VTDPRLLQDLVPLVAGLEAQEFCYAIA